MKSIPEWTKDIERMKYEILGWASNTNSNSVGATFIQRNKTKLYTFGLFGISGTVFYFVGFITLARICGLILGLQVGSWIWNGLKYLIKD